MKRILAAAAIACFSFASSALAQQPARQPEPRPSPGPVRGAAAPQTGRLVVTVVDQTGAVLPTANVAVDGIEDATKMRAPNEVVASDQGVAAIAGLTLGRYTVKASFSGFETTIVKDTRVRSGDNKLTITLALEKMTDSVTVGQDATQAASDPHGSSFGTALTRDQIDSLSDDPDTLNQQLADIGGPGATIRIDSFEGGTLPPKSQIKSIHVTRDGFAAENHSSGQVFVEIITQPGVGALRGGFNTRYRDGRFSGRNQITQAIQPERTEDFGLNLGGSLVHNRASFSLQFNGNNNWQQPYLNTVTGNQLLNVAAVDRKQNGNNYRVYGSLDYALTRDQTLRMSYSQNNNVDRNIGIGQYDLSERAYKRDNQNYQFRIQEAGPLGRRFFTNTRLSLNNQNSDSVSSTEAPTLRVVDAFTSGGAQQRGGRHGKTFNFASDLDYVRGIHSVRAGVQLDGGWYKSDDESNYLGTYTFSSLTAYNDATLGPNWAGRPLNDDGTPVAATTGPSSFTQRVGNPLLNYFTMQSGIYLQDDIRVRKNLTLSPGIRWEAQTHLKDNNAFGPRFGITWAPTKSGHTTLRASAGIFYDWLIPDTFEQTLRVDGFRQKQINILPTVDSQTQAVIAQVPYPNPGVGTSSPSDRYLLQPDLHFMHYRRVSTGIDQAVTPKLRVSATYAYTYGDGLWRGKNLNSPLADGTRPNPSFANIVQVTNDAGSKQHQLTTSLQWNPGGPQNGPPGSGPRFDKKRVNVNINYTLSSFRNNTDNRFALPPTGDPQLEWGPAPGDVRHRLGVNFNSTQIRNFNASLQVNKSTGSPFSKRSLVDLNNDGSLNDRPYLSGTTTEEGRNIYRTDGQFTTNLFMTYTFPIGHATVAAPPGVGVQFGPGGAPPVITSFAQSAPPRYRLALICQVQNLTNHANYGGYVTSDSASFGQPTTVSNPRRIDIGFGLTF